MTDTLVTEVTDDPERAAWWLRGGACVAFPTETVYGLGADATDAEAVARIFRAKGRPPDNPLIVHLADRDQLSLVARDVPPVAGRILDRFAPGPVTVILPRDPRIPASVSAGLDTVGIRIPGHETARAFLLACGRPVAAPSANRSGRPSPTTWEAVLTDLEGRIPCVLRGPRSRVGLESTVVDCTTDVPVILRAGAVTLEALRTVAPGARIADADDALARRSPGTRHPHYAPRARVHVVTDPRPAADAAWIGMGAVPDGYGITCPVRSVAEYAHMVFDFFRRCDAIGMQRIDCRQVARRGLGLALMDRLERAASATSGDACD